MTPGPLFRKSLLWRLIGTCMLGLIAIATAHTINWLAKFEAEIEGNFYIRGRETTEIIADAVANAVWNFDDTQAAEVMAGFAQIDGFVHAEVFAEGTSFARFSALGGTADANPDAPAPASDDVILFRRLVTHESGREIGSLVTGFSITPTQALVRQNRIETILSQLLSFGLLALLLTAVLRSVTSPLRDITGVIDDVTGGDLGREVPFLDREDEVGRLAKAVSLFQENAETLISVEAEAEANRQIARHAVTDALTGLPNRRALTNLFETLETQGDPAPDRSIALLHMDLDGFKQINDTLGHKAGDHILLCVADQLRKVEHRCRLIARIGGDEFVCVVTGLTPESDAARDLADTLIPSIRTPTEFEGQAVRVGCSVGIGYHISANRDLLETLVQADIALYKAKANGKNQWVEFDEEQRRALVERKTLTDEIQAGIERGEFIPYFQPIVDARTGEIRSLEVLSRWNHPTRGLVGPNVYIPLARELKFLRFIDRTILNQAIDVLNAIEGDLPCLPRLSVNVSVERLMETDLLDIARALRDTPIRLDIELLESAYIDEVADNVIWRLDALRELGVGIHIDDFGTGHSSLAGLLKVSPDVMKIDGRFVSIATHSAKERTLVESMVGIARTFDIEIVCEGIETAEQAEMMRTLGCDMLQGFHFFRPMDADALRPVLLARRPGASGPAEVA